MAITIPQIKIQSVLEELITLIKTQHETKIAADLESESWLYRVFYGLKADTFDYYQQAIEILINRDEESIRQLKIRRDFDRTRAMLPTIFINTPSENQAGVNSIGLNLEGTGTYYTNDDDTTTESYARSFQGTYELMITSENKDECEMIYRFLQAVFIAFADTLSMTFDGTFSFSGKQLVPNPSVIPTPLMIRVWTINIEEKIEVPRFNDDSYASDLTFDGTPQD